MKIRKPVNELTLEDLEKYPIWEFALDEECEDGQDETTVRPYSIDGPADPTEGMLIVKARFTLADGTTMFGYLTPPHPSSPDSSYVRATQPYVITPSGQVGFWNGVRKPSNEDLAVEYQRLERGAERIFPMHFQSEAPVVGGPVIGVVNAFLYMELENQRVHEIR